VITYNTNPKYLLHMQLSFPTPHSALISQSNYIGECLKHYNYDSLEPKRTPLPKGAVVSPCPHDPNGCASAEHAQEIQAKIGSIMYAGTKTRADARQAVGQLSRFMAKPCKAHLVLLEHVFAYLKRTKDCRLRFGGQAGSTIELLGYSDANFPNSLDAKATVGSIWNVRLGEENNWVHWESHTLKHVVTSTEEAELAAASDAIKEGLALRSILSDLALLPRTALITLYVDNKAAVTVANDGGYYPKLKHVNRIHKFIMEAVAEKQVKVVWLPGTQMVADALTKQIGGPQLDQFRKLLFV
jgi:hypothetical protein